MNIKYKDNQVKEILQIQFDEILIRQQVEIKDIFGYYCYFGFYFRHTSISECCYSGITIFWMWHVWITRRYKTHYFSIMHVFPLSHFISLLAFQYLQCLFGILLLIFWVCIFKHTNSSLGFWNQVLSPPRRTSS